MSETFQSFVGVDLHKCTVTLAAVSPEGEKIAWLKISTKSTGKIEEWLLALPRPVHLADGRCRRRAHLVRGRGAREGRRAPSPGL